MVRQLVCALDLPAIQMTNELLREPVPEIMIVDCPDEETWKKLLLQSNARKNGETEKQSNFLRNQSDLERLKTAILMKKIISLNAADHILKLRNFTRGRLLRMPTIREEDVELIDADVATCFYHSELYYSALRESLQRFHCLSQSFIWFGLRTTVTIV